MNHQVRQFLIGQCISKQPVYYEDVARLMKIDLSDISNRNLLSRTLGEISAFEHEHGRPLISAIAVYKGSNDHGPGFYAICEELGIGEANELEKDFYGMQQMEESRKFWKQQKNYDTYFNLAKPTRHKVEFFQKKEIEFLHEWGGRVYDKTNKEHVAAKNYIMESLGTKTQYWSEQLVKAIPGMETFNWRMWSTKGWAETESGSVRVAKFKDYTWARIYRKGDDKKDIFFTVGAAAHDKPVLVYKLDYYYQPTSYLSKEQQELVSKNRPKDVEWRSIPIEKLENYSWDSLIQESKSFIIEHLHLYDKLIQIAWEGQQPESIFNDFLRLQQPPKGITHLPQLSPSFKPVEKDYLLESIEHQEIGEIGERLVLEYEKKKLINAGLPALADKVIKAKDGQGYDILSYDDSGKPFYIEVKTTEGAADNGFYLSLNEKLFAEKFASRHQIYRLYNLDIEKQNADFYKIENILENLLLQPTEYRAHIKST